MSPARDEVDVVVLLTQPRSEGEREEMRRMGFLDEHGRVVAPPERGERVADNRAVRKRAISNAAVLNEAYDYEIPSSFARGLRMDLRTGTTFLWISGTASVDESGMTIHAGDFRAQCWRTWRNITELLRSEGATWHDVVRTTCYLRDIERDYRDFNEIRTHFLRMQNVAPLPASTGIQARLCREDLLVEIEAIAVVERKPTGT